MQIHDRRTYAALLTRGTLGAADAYIDGWWTSSDLVALIRLLLQNGKTIAQLDDGLAGWLAKAASWSRCFRRNTPSGSRRNIRDHYDLGDDFFRLFLDETMAYSSGIFPHREASLKDASIEKFDRACRLLQLTPADHVLEIGSGWGGFAMHAARKYGCRVTTTTLSKNQYDFVRASIADAGLSDRIEVRLDDYRQLNGVYDKIASIEMIEAVGHEFLPVYFRTCSERLRPTGAMLLQAITIVDGKYDSYRSSLDFIQKHIFPGGILPSRAALQGAIAAGDLVVRRADDCGIHYAETMKHWRHRFRASLDAIRRLGFDDRFLRKWHYYFCYCEAGFRERQISVGQYLLAKPGCQIVPYAEESPCVLD